MKAQGKSLVSAISRSFYCKEKWKGPQNEGGCEAADEWRDRADHCFREAREAMLEAVKSNEERGMELWEKVKSAADTVGSRWIDLHAGGFNGDPVEACLPLTPIVFKMFAKKCEFDVFCRIFPGVRPKSFFNKMLFFIKKHLPGRQYKLDFPVEREEDGSLKRDSLKNSFLHIAVFLFVRHKSESKEAPFPSEETESKIVSPDAEGGSYRRMEKFLERAWYHAIERPAEEERQAKKSRPFFSWHRKENQSLTALLKKVQEGFYQELVLSLRKEKELPVPLSQKQASPYQNASWCMSAATPPSGAEIVDVGEDAVDEEDAVKNRQGCRLSTEIEGKGLLFLTEEMSAETSKSKKTAYRKLIKKMKNPFGFLTRNSKKSKK